MTEALKNALSVIVLDPKLSALIAESDPKAFAQACAALELAKSPLDRLKAELDPTVEAIEAELEQNDFETALASFVEKLQVSVNEHYAKNYKNLSPSVISVDPRGSKYKRIVTTSGSSRSVHCFIEVATGDIWKAASWKAPAKNFPRGNIYNDDPTTGTNVYGVN